MLPDFISQTLDGKQIVVSVKAWLEEWTRQSSTNALWNGAMEDRKYKRLQEHNVHMYKWVLLPVARQHKSQLFVPAHGSIVLSRQITHSRVRKEYNQDHRGLSQGVLFNPGANTWELSRYFFFFLMGSSASTKHLALIKLFLHCCVDKTKNHKQETTKFKYFFVSLNH